jgi:hypothetical protein
VFLPNIRVDLRAEVIDGISELLVLHDMLLRNSLDA